MVLLLAGSSELGRTVIARKLLEDKPEWRHLPYENLEEAVARHEIGESINDDVTAQIAVHCAQELIDEGYHLVLSMPGGEQLEMLRDGFQGACVTVVLGGDVEAEDIDCTIDTSSASVNDSAQMIERLIARYPEGF